MNKSLKFGLLSLVLACMFALAAFATATIEYNKEVVNAETGVNKIVVTIKNPRGNFATFKSTVTFDNSIIIPVSAKTGKDANIAGGTVKTPIIVLSYYDEDTEEDASVDHSPTSPKWVVDGTKATLDIEIAKAGVKIDTTDKMAFEMYYRYADGKSASDLVEGSFVIDYVKYADLVTGIEAFNSDKDPNTLTIVNKVVESKPDVLTISVKKDDIVYFQDDSVVKITEDNDKYPLPSKDDGYVVVNTGFTAQKLYKVTSGAITEVTSNENGVLATDSASLRKDSVATGLRFKSSFATALKNTVKEYGYLVTVESAYNALPADYVLNMDLVIAGKAKKGIAFNKADGTDIYFNVDGARTIVTAVATNIPLTKDAVTTNIVARPYYELEDGTIVYGETVKRQAAEVAQKIKAEDAETYAKYKDYIDAIVALVAEDPNYAIIDLGPLFS